MRKVLSSTAGATNKNLQVYRELFQNPPFPAWRSASRMGDACSALELCSLATNGTQEGLKKQGLDDIWN